MAKAGDSYVVTLKEAHLAWGEYRHTNTRDVQYGEAYIQIPADIAYDYNIMSFKGAGSHDSWGKNLFHCVSSDGFLCGVLRAQGEQSNESYAKQFAIDKDLKAIGRWYDHVDAKAGDQLKLTWLDETSILVEKL